MTTDAIPQLHAPVESRTETRAYGDASRRFGAPHAAPALGDALAVGRIADWSPAQMLEVASAGATDPNALEDADVARICLAFVELVGQRDAVMQSHLLVSAENVALRHRLAGTTPVAETIAQSRTPTLDDQLDALVLRYHPTDDDVETEIIDIPLPTGRIS